MLKRWTLVVLLSLAAGCAANRPADDDEEITLDQVPPAAKATILAEANGAEITDVERETDHDGRIVYEAEWIEDGREVEIKVAPDGALLHKAFDDD